MRERVRERKRGRERYDTNSMDCSSIIRRVTILSIDVTSILSKDYMQGGVSIPRFFCISLLS